MTVTDANLRTTVWTDIRTAIVGIAPFVTNSSTSATTVASINAQYNDKYTTKPQVVIIPIESDETLNRFGGTEGKKTINVFVECYYKNSLGVDQLADQITAGVKSTDFDGIDLIGVTSDYGFNTINDSKYPVINVTFTFDRE